MLLFKILYSLYFTLRCTIYSYAHNNHCFPFQQYVNQDTSWDVPSSPEPTGKADGTSGSAPWKPPVNNGTELWEANLRTGGQPPPQQPQQQKVPWGHTPSNNIGGTWGEDEEAETSSTAWPAPNSNQQQWNSSAGK